MKKWSCFIIGILYGIFILFIVNYYSFPGRKVFWLVSIGLLAAGSVIASLPYKSTAFYLEFSTIIITWLLFKGKSFENVAFLYLPLITATLIAVSFKTFPRITALPVWLLTAAWILFCNKISIANLNPVQYILLACTAIMLIIYTLSVFMNKKTELHKIDLLLSSYSGNTTHYANLFIDGVKERGAEVIVHRFHYYKSFKLDLKGDSLVIAFPVFGWKPPWPMLYYLFRLPWGKGKPAFVLYSCAGGPENTGMLMWAILTFRGYRVIGRNWGWYPVNIATVRLGPARLWKYLDSLLPLRMDMEDGVNTGRDFAEGNYTGLPFIFWPSPLAVLGIILDNKYLDMIYRNHVMRSRCIKCGACVEFCPSERLKLVNGYPKAKGSCIICFGCINICPKNAMHLWLFTEYGNAYRSHATSAHKPRKKQGNQISI